MGSFPETYIDPNEQVETVLVRSEGISVGHYQKHKFFNDMIISSVIPRYHE